MKLIDSMKFKNAIPVKVKDYRVLLKALQLFIRFQINPFNGKCQYDDKTSWMTTGNRSLKIVPFRCFNNAEHN